MAKMSFLDVLRVTRLVRVNCPQCPRFARYNYISKFKWPLFNVEQVDWNCVEFTFSKWLPMFFYLQRT